MHSIRRATPEDKEILMALMKITWKTTYPEICNQEPSRVDRMFSESNVVKLLNDPDIYFFIAFNSEKKPIAYSKALIKYPYSFLDKLYVLPEAQGQGVGKSLIAENYLSAVQDGVNTMALEVADTNHDAQAFYKQLGFRARNIKRLYPTTGPTLSYGIKMICFDLRSQLERILFHDFYSQKAMTGLDLAIR